MEIKVAINGVCGRMGRALQEAVAVERGMVLSAAFERDDSPHIGGQLGSGVAVSPAGRVNEMDYDVLVDFTLADASIAALRRCADAKRMAVVGTTGFSAGQQAEVVELSRVIPIVQAPNMSLGVNVCFSLLEKAASILKDGDMDVDIVEAHHKGKRDAPSGTALRMGQMIMRGLGGRRLSERTSETGILTRDGIAYHVIRAGDLAGEHKLILTLPGEQIELTHRSSGRANFARGALAAARWLGGKKRPAGLYGMQDVLGLV